MRAAPLERAPERGADEAWLVLGVLDGDGRLLFGGDAARALLGREPAELIGRSVVELVVPADRMRWMRAFAELARQSTQARVQVGLLDLTDQPRALECRLRRLQGGAEAFAAVLELRAPVAVEPERTLVFEKASGEVQGTAAAPQSKPAELEAILRALPDLFFRFDAEGRFLDFSAPANSLLYAPPSLFLGKRPHSVMPPELADAMEQARAETHRIGALVTIEYALEVGGKRQHCEARYVPHVDGQTIALVRDVTDRIEAEAALRLSEARLVESQKLDAIGRLAGGVAHDFNNLLMIILGYTAAVARHVTPPHPAALALSEIGKAVDRATALTRQLLALSRPQPVQPTILDLGALLKEMGNMLGRVIGEHIAFSTEVQPGLACLQADRSQIEQVVLNLLLNARDAMPTGGSLRIRAENVSPAEADTHAEGPRYVSLSVTDTGEGMAADTQARIFEPFFTTKARGTGLGLFTVNHIVSECGGTIRVNSQIGRGTEIVVRLPAVQQTPDSVVPERSEPIRGGGETVLLVEDEEPVRALLVEVLSHLGYRVLVACNAQEAHEVMRGHRADIHLLLTDVVMPGSSGWQLAREVRSQRPSCRVLYMSGHAIHAEDASRSGLVQGELLHKPFTPSALAQRVRELLDAPSNATKQA
jgi:two-component system, cell cycle sensor histidine kinase and response regulator CckA